MFRNCRLIGRRFRLAHVRFGREIIEVATFRARRRRAGDDERAHSDSGRILRDNVYGTIDEDVWRRDFTVNALYYNIADFSIWDYVGGVEDIRARTLRLIGDPGDALSRGPGAHAARRAFRGEARLRARAGDGGADRVAWRAAARRAAGAPVRRAPEAVSQRPRCEELRLARASYDLLRYLFRDTAALLETPRATRSRVHPSRAANTDERDPGRQARHADVPIRSVPLVPDPALALKLQQDGWNDDPARSSRRVSAMRRMRSKPRFRADSARR